MLKLSYSTNGITNVDFFRAVDEIEKAGFEGVEISFQKGQFNPFTIGNSFLSEVRDFFSQKKITPVAISTGTTYFLSDEFQHEPSIIYPEASERKRRVDLIKRGIDIAKKLDVPVVSFQTGYLREEHVRGNLDVRKILVESIKECLEDIGDVTLVIEPEPGMYVETLKDGADLVKEIDSPSFGLHLDIGHAFCTEEDYVGNIGKYLPLIKYIHLADIRDGYNLQVHVLKVLEDVQDLKVDLDFAGQLLYFSSSNSFLFFDKKTAIYFSNEALNNKQSEELAERVKQKTSNVDIKWVSLSDVPDRPKEKDVSLEVKAYIDSIPAMNQVVLEEKFAPILYYLREKSIVHSPFCFTLRGKVHYHEFPGKGGIDFMAVLEELKRGNYGGYVTVELYNHVDVWPEVIPGSYKYLSNLI